MSNGPSAADYAADAAELDAKIIDLKNNHGRSFRQIAAELDLSHAYVHRCFWRGIRSIVEPAVTAYRQSQLAEIIMEREVANEVVTGTHPLVSHGRIVYPITGRDADGKPIYAEDPLLDDGPRLAGLAALDRLADREAKLLGLYPASKMDLGGAVQITINGVDPAADLT